MKFQVKYLDAAKLDVKEITSYLAQFHAKSARNFKEKLTNQVNLLKSTPYICEAYERDPFFRRMVVGDYCLFYSVDEHNKLVMVHRALHHSRNANWQLSRHQQCNQ